MSNNNSIFKKLKTNDNLIILANFTNYFDTSLYVFMVPILSDIFFPTDNIIMSNILTYSVLCVSIIAKPIGSYVFGILVKIIEPGKLLFYTIACTAFTTSIMAILPSYELIGKFSPIILLLLRIIQGIFSSGESTIASIYLLQNKSELISRKNNYIYETSSVLALCAASAVSTLVMYIDIVNIWRICFFFSGLLGIFICYIRYNEFKQIPPKKNIKNLTVDIDPYGIKTLLQNKKKILQIILITNCTYVTYYIPLVFMNSFIPMITKNITVNEMMSVNNFLLIFDVIMLFFMGKIMLPYKTEKILIITIFSLALTIIPIWYFLDIESIIYVSIVRSWIVFCGITITSQMNVYFTNLFKTDDMYLIIGTGKSISAAIFGKTLPAICLLIFYQTNSSVCVAIYLFIIFVAALIALKV